MSIDTHRQSTVVQDGNEAIAARLGEFARSHAARVAEAIDGLDASEDVGAVTKLLRGDEA